MQCSSGPLHVSLHTGVVRSCARRCGVPTLNPKRQGSVVPPRAIRRAASCAIRALGLWQRSRRHASTLHCAIVGSGPSGVYTGKYLLKDVPDIKIDFFDAVPAPFGLVRYGVAPDHPEVKLVQNDFATVMSDPRCRFFGGVRLGTHISLQELRGIYPAVILAYGAAQDRALGIPGEELGGVHSARAFVNWYNGHPDYSSQSFSTELQGDSRTAVVVGQGNVAIDVARILCSDVNRLASTDIATHAVTELRASTLSVVHVLGRRGPVQAAFTTAEFRELAALSECSVQLSERDFDEGLNAASLAEAKSSRALNRKLELLRQSLSSPKDRDVKASRTIPVDFLWAPVAALPSASNPERIGSLTVERTRLVGPAGSQRAEVTGERRTIPCDLLLRSVGYRSIPIEGAPFDQARAVIPSAAGRVMADGRVLGGLYVSGWLKRGPTGIIGSNIPDAKETATSVAQDASMLAAATSVQSVHAGAIGDLLVQRGLKYVSWNGWLKIDQAEQVRGQIQRKPRDKIISVDEMIRVANTL